MELPSQPRPNQTTETSFPGAAAASTPKRRGRPSLTAEEKKLKPVELQASSVHIGPTPSPGYLAVHKGQLPLLRLHYVKKHIWYEWMELNVLSRVSLEDTGALPQAIDGLLETTRFFAVEFPFSEISAMHVFSNDAAHENVLMFHLRSPPRFSLRPRQSAPLWKSCPSDPTPSQLASSYVRHFISVPKGIAPAKSRLNQTQRFDDGLETLFTCQPWLRQLASVLPAPSPSEDSLRYSAETLAAWRQTLTRPHERPAKRLRLPSTPSAASSPLLPQHLLLLPPSPNQVSPLPAVATVATTSTALPLQEAALPLQEPISSAAQPLSHVHRSLVPELLELAPSQPLPDHLPVVPAPAGAPLVADLPIVAIPTIPTHAPTSDDPPCVPTMVQHSLGVEVGVQAPTSLTDD